MTATGFTYANILCDLVSITEETSLEFYANLDRIIHDGEQRLAHDLNIDLVMAEYTLATTAHSRTIDIPSGLLRADTLHVLDGTSRVLLLKRDHSYCHEFAPNISLEDTPKLYADDDTETYYLVPTPDAVYTLYAHGLIRPTGLSEASPTSWFSTYFPDLLLQACLIAAEEHLTNPVQVGAWRASYNQRLPRAQQECSKLRAP